MTLGTRITRQVSPIIQQRGRQYFSSGAVRIVQGGPASVTARVWGTSDYEVTLVRNKKTVRAWCTCPYCDEFQDTCKHIWATLLAADARRYLRGKDHTEPQGLYLDQDLAEMGEWEADGIEDADEYEEDEYEDDDEFASEDPYSYTPPPQGRPKRRQARPPTWRQSLGNIQKAMTPPALVEYAPVWPAGREILYIVNIADTLKGNGLVLEVASRQRKMDGDWSKPKGERIPINQIERLPEPADREILTLLHGAREQTSYGPGYTYYSSSAYDTAACRYQLSEPQQRILLPLVCRTGRCRLRLLDENADLRELHWDENGPWQFWLTGSLDEKGKHYLVNGQLRRGEERLDVKAPLLLTADGLVCWEDRVAPLDDAGAFGLLALFRRQGTFLVPLKDAAAFVEQLLQLPRLPFLDLPEGLRFEEAAPQPRPRLLVRKPESRLGGRDRLAGELSFDYDGQLVAAKQPGHGVYQASTRRFLRRDVAAEQVAVARLQEVGFRQRFNYRQQELELATRNLPRVLRTLLAEGWHVEAEGKIYRRPGTFEMNVTSGIDWFEVNGKVEYGDTSAPLPELLAALKRGDNIVRLGDGTFGMLPDDWLKKYGVLAGLGTVEGDHLRFKHTQVGLLDALLAAQPEATFDKTFARLRDELHSFAGIEPADPPASFVGQLRGYQRDGLGWLYFLQKFGFGGCLADDMGLGKTIQVLALLEARREQKAGPSLVVVPRSLVFNWKGEAARFTPQLRILDHTGIGRVKPGEHFREYDVVLTTYGTLRRDALQFKDQEFDYCILDEAQAIKNARSESAKAARLLRAHHRLILSGTPVENHLGELWSLFEFLNPGMLGTTSVFRLGEGGLRNPSEETRTLLARALRPFILRRTKGQVAKDLPEKLEQTIYCELEGRQRQRYDELRAHYRQSLLAKVERDGMKKAQIQILEALLRLRQAACHPGLIDKDRVDESSAKLDVLLPQLTEVMDEGHKVLVFSQFTSLLAIVRARLDKEGIRYEYLDGRTRDRAARVEHFQNDTDCKLFLISLKAGGLGLNLTAADYVFLLDPWWNPAVEAQAIDRTHRIGQQRPVFAYRLIAKDTIEEKVLQLQESKRALADAIITADNSVMRNLSRDDLELLLS